VTEHEDGRITHGIDHDGGSFVVSSKEVGVAIQNFLHYATLLDIITLHNHLLREYARRYMEEQLTVPSYETQRENAIIRTRGIRDGENAASWLIDGNTPDTAVRLLDLVKGMDDGDPEVLDSLPTPRLGGEWADEPTWEDICMEEINRYEDGEDDLYAIYTEAFHDGVESQIRKMNKEWNHDA